MLQEQLVQYLRSKYFGKHEVPVQIGVYRPSVLSWSCLRRQYNYYKQLHGKHQEEIPDNIVLLLGGGIVFHELIESLPIWDQTEIECSLRVNVAGGEIVIVGHADAIRGDTIYEFKHTRSLPREPYFQHKIQLNFYLSALNRLKGVLAYTGYDSQGGLSVREFSLRYSDWLLEHLINRAQALHLFLLTDEAPRCSCQDKRHEGNLVI